MWFSFFHHPLIRIGVALKKEKMDFDFQGPPSKDGQIDLFFFFDPFPFIYFFILPLDSEMKLFYRDFFNKEFFNF